MILLREIQERDIDAIERLAQVPGMFNLQADRDALREKVKLSTRSLSQGAMFRRESKFIFVAEDVSTGQIVGTSMIASQHGTEEAPHFYFEVGSEQKISTTINTGFIHGTLKLKYDTDGPSEIGALVIDPTLRNRPDRAGRQISFVRFLYLALHREQFKKKIIAELLPPLNKKGQSPLWEAIGRRFTNMDYWEADALCSKSKEFIVSLFPSGKIYTTFLSAEARNAIGKVGKDTEAVLHMLRKIGFEYKNHVDPFDGGPHLWADVEKIAPVKKLILSEWGSSNGSFQAGDLGLVTSIEPAQPGTFRAIAARVDESRLLQAEPELISALGLKAGQKIAFMPYY